MGNGYQVDVNVNQTSSGNAVETTRQAIERLQEQAKKEFPQTVEKIQQLYKAAGNYEAKNMPEAAQSARQEAKTLEGDLSRYVKERHETEKRVTLEHKERAAIAKAQEGRASRIGRASANLAEGVTGGSGVGNFVTTLMGAGLPGIIAGAVAASTVGIMAAFSKQGRAEELIEVTAAGNRNVQNRRLERSASFEGSSGASRGEAEGFKDEQIRLAAEGKKLEVEARLKWWSASSWKAHLTGESENPRSENIEAQRLAQEGETRARATQRQKFAEVGMPAVQAAEREVQMDMRGARAINDKIALVKEYNRLRNEGANPEEATRGASAAVAILQRQRSGMFASLISGATGTAGTARIAQMAREQRLGGATFGGTDTPALDKLITTINGNHSQAMGAMRTPKLRQPGL